MVCPSRAYGGEEARATNPLRVMVLVPTPMRRAASSKPVRPPSAAQASPPAVSASPAVRLMLWVLEHLSHLASMRVWAIPREIGPPGTACQRRIRVCTRRFQNVSEFWRTVIRAVGGNVGPDRRIALGQLGEMPVDLFAA